MCGSRKYPCIPLPQGMDIFWNCAIMRKNCHAYSLIFHNTPVELKLINYLLFMKLFYYNILTHWLWTKESGAMLFNKDFYVETALKIESLLHKNCLSCKSCYIHFIWCLQVKITGNAKSTLLPQWEAFLPSQHCSTALVCPCTCQVWSTSTVWKRNQTCCRQTSRNQGNL